MYQLCPSILSADFNRLGEQIKTPEKEGIEWLQIDVIDGDFVELPKIYNGIVINNTTLNEELDVVLVHYIDYIKPWHIYYMDSNAKELYWEYVKKSLWSDMKPMDGKTVQTELKKARL